MKVLAALATLLLSAQAFALPSRLNCSNGEMGSDAFLQVTVTSRFVDFGMHETHIAAKRSDLRVAGNTIAILERTLRGSAEGEDLSVKTSALLVFNPSTRFLNVTLVLDGHVQIAAQNLKCN